MRHHNQRARPGIQQVLDRGQRIRVQIIRRLIEKQHVRFIHEQTHELKPAPLAAGQLRHPRPRPLAREAQPLDQLTGGDLLLTHGHARGNLMHGLHHTLLANGIKLICGLRQRRKLDRLATLDPSGGWLQLSRHQPQQRGLSGTVGTKNSQPLTGSQPQRHIL